MNRIMVLEEEEERVLFGEQVFRERSCVDKKSSSARESGFFFSLVGRDGVGHFLWGSFSRR